jgi:Gram-negative porin
MKKSTLLFAIVAVALISSRKAAAEIDIAKNHGWELTNDGRINTFLSFSRGEAQPGSAPLWEGVEDRPDTGGNIQNTRIRNGFLLSILGFNLRKQLAPDVMVTGRIGMWLMASASRSKSDNPPADMREVYVKVEGPFGGVLAGRNLSLFGRGGIMLDYDIEHAYGLGYPCAVRTISGAACGHAGFGLLFPGFNTGLVYNTPEVAGLQLSAGAYDPSVITTYAYETTPYPRFEGELTFKVPKYFRLFLDGFWQRLQKQTSVNGTNVDQKVDAQGYSAGAGLTLGPFAAGFTTHGGQGMGLLTALEDHPIVADDQHFVLRKFTGYLGLASLTFGDTRIAGGYGVTKVKKNQYDPDGPVASNVLLKQEAGYSAGVYQTINKTLILALEYFHAQYDWYEVLTGDGSSTSPRQIVHFVNAGVTLIW